MAVQSTPPPQNGPPAEVELEALQLVDRTGESEVDNATGHHLLLEADDFVAQYALDDIRDQIRKAALLVDDPDDFVRVEGLKEEEKHALQGKSKKWSCFSKYLLQRWRLPTYLCHVGGVLLSCSEIFAMGGFVYVNKVDIPPTRLLLWFAIKFVGFWVVFPANIYFGRRRTICFAAMAMIPASFGANPKGPTVLRYITTPVSAITVGVCQCTVAPYLAELSPAHQRGAVVSSWILNQTLSILFVFNLFTVVSLAGITIGTFLTTCCLLACCWFSPESPYVSFRMGQVREAYDILCRSRRHEILAACDLYRMHLFFAREQEKKSLESKDYQPGLISRILPSRGIQRAMVALGSVAITQIIPRALIEYMKLNIDLGFTGILLIVVIMLFVGIRPISMPVLDLIGRRKLVLGAMIITPLIIVLECIGRRYDNWVVVMYAHLLLLVPIGVQTLLPVVYATEVFPLESRDVGMAIGASMLFASNMAARWIIAHFKDPTDKSEQFSDSYYGLATLVSFGIAQGLMAVGVYLFMRETVGHQLEDIGPVFETRTRDLVRYRIMIHLPYMFKRYFLWKDVQPCSFELSKYNSRYEGKAVDGEDVERLLAWGEP